MAEPYYDPWDRSLRRRFDTPGIARERLTTASAG
jgi:hypothetical protein